MKVKLRRLLVVSVIAVLLLGLAVALFCIFFDEAVFVRKGTVYRVPMQKKVVAFTFDDGPSPVWTPQILSELKRAGIKATFFMLGEHVRKYPDIVRQVLLGGHEIGNHSYTHHVLIYYTKEELEKEVRDTERAIQEVAGYTTNIFRPPKGWLTTAEKKQLKDMGYAIVLWSLNSKDWVTFDDKYIVRYIVRNIRPGDIILFHDSGGVFGTEGGDRSETVRVIFRLTERLREKGYSFVTVSELVRNGNGN